MGKMKLVIVGGVAAGASAAAKARRCSEEAGIVILEKGEHISYANCGLPYYLGGVIKKRDELLISDPEFFRQRFGVTVKVGHEVTRIDRQKKEVHGVDHGTGAEFALSYDRLVLAPGADAVVPPLAGVDLPHVFQLKTLADTDRIQRFIEERQPRSVAIVGGGLIGIEAMENFVHLGMQVSVVEFMPQLLTFLDPEMADVVAGHARQKGVTLHLSEKVTAITPAVVETDQGSRVLADLVIMAVGVRPNVKLAKDAGLAIGERGGIVVDEFMRTSDPDVFAAGDCVESVNLVTGQKALIPMGSAANKQGRAAGANAMGRSIAVKGFTGTVIVKAFDLAVGKTGLSEKEAVVHGFDAEVAYVLAGHHAGYYPGGKVLRIKTVVDRGDGRLLGAQVIGEEGVDKRIDVFATAIYARMAAEDLVQLDLAYAPPYSSAKDPVIVSGMLHGNSRSGDWQPISPAALAVRLEKGDDCVVLDVRTAFEVKRSGRIPGAVHVPVDELRRRLGELDPMRETIVYCAVGLRSYLASRILSLNGFRDVKTLTGGTGSWGHAMER